MIESGGRTTGPWQDRVAFSPEGGGVAYRPGEVLVRAVDADRTEQLLDGGRRDSTGAFVRFELPVEPRNDVVAAVHDLRLQGVEAQPNHVLLSHCGGGCCCGPHPSGAWGANPFQANPFQANLIPLTPFQANPFQANPFQANPFQANPFQANPEYRATGHRDHSARPATAPSLPAYPYDPTTRSKPSIVVLDTGLAAGALRPHALHALAVDPANAEQPDEDGDGSIDPVAGHGTFIAGLIERMAPGCELSVNGLVGGYGDVDEVTVADALDALVDPTTGAGPDLLNMSFGGYALEQMPRLAQAVRRVQAAGTVVVASAGNDATCRPSFPAALPGVVSVAALGPHGPAFFTNHGDWVRACAPGVDVVSTFFSTWDPPGDGRHYAEWVSWSGTSFAAPAVVGALARRMREGMSGPDAVAQLLDDPSLLRLPGLGTVVNEGPCWQIP